ncbi:hypothetical protein B0A48_18712 [Cryoendolithus antarcticus]|uniref:Uncharacterized protein n=1 Tax=Cryoendolithus antarcticus TaxID=1507870 RepID=A0A1V8S7V4_9PEZI|nr:hypothetical protein B0A48_18712 [Cryoendolithus antarcticus]
MCGPMTLKAIKAPRSWIAKKRDLDLLDQDPQSHAPKLKQVGADDPKKWKRHLQLRYQHLFYFPTVDQPFYLHVRDANARECVRIAWGEWDYHRTSSIQPVAGGLKLGELRLSDYNTR